jgi:hypothetical protein
MRSKYTTENDVAELVRSFEECTISREEWKHAEHLLVALTYVTRYDADVAVEKMRSGILRLLEAFGVDLKIENPYHETLTVFWIRTIRDFSASNTGMSLPELVGDLIARFDKDYPLLFYSREMLFSDRARKEYIEPDRSPADQIVRQRLDQVFE